MTKEQMLQALKEGKKVTHNFFTSDEWMQSHGNDIIFEDGCICTHEEFFRWRQDKWWNTGWSIVEASNDS